jgi:DNA polymerase III delta prime subunit|tara:strand:- start:684 stop:1484 length:801 start_codon:yes stop_codon:yes gene_type:complete
MSLTIHENIVEKLNNFIENKKIPNLIFHGTSGCGKKTILFNFLKQVYKSEANYMKKYVMVVNCAHGKGIKFIREELKFFARSNINLNEGSIFKSILLLNADKLTIDAQSALRRCIELFSHSTRFFIVVDDKYKLLKPILSRFCEIFIPVPIINGKEMNLHTYNLNNCFSTTKLNKQKNTKFKNELEKIKEQKVTNISETLYEKGYSALDLTEYIKTMEIDEIKRYEYLVFIQKIKREFRDEKILMACILNFILKRLDYQLENISFM